MPLCSTPGYSGANQRGFEQDRRVWSPAIRLDDSWLCVLSVGAQTRLAVTTKFKSCVFSAHAKVRKVLSSYSEVHHPCAKK